VLLGLAFVAIQLYLKVSIRLDRIENKAQDRIVVLSGKYTCPPESPLKSWSINNRIESNDIAVRFFTNRNISDFRTMQEQNTDIEEPI